MRRIISIFILMITVASATVFAMETNDSPKYSIRGIVLDEDGQPLPGASVVVLGTTIGAGTNADGEFTVILRKPGKQTLQISFVGYKSKNIEASTSSNKKYTIRLNPSDNFIDEVVITGSRVEKPLKEIPVITRVISSADIKRSNPQDFQTLLQYELPGIQIGYNSMSQAPTITYQGVGGDYIVFLVDGERVSGEGAAKNVDFSRFNVDEIERIEVVRGAASTLYDSNALGGVINIITKSANRPFSGNVSARYAGVNGENYSLSVGTKKSRYSTYTTLGYRHKDTYTVGDETGKDITVVLPDGSTETKKDNAYNTTIYGYQIWDASQKVGYSFTDKLSGEVKGSLYHNKRDVREGKKFQEVYLDYTLSGKMKYLINDNHILDLSYIWDRYDKNQDYWEVGRKTKDFSHRQQTLRLNYTGNVGNHSFSAGIEGETEYMKHYMMRDSSHFDRKHLDIYAQDDWKVTDDFSIVLGVRADTEDKYPFHVTPKISTMYHLGKQWIFRAGYAQGYRTPSLKELYSAYDMGGLGWFMIYGNENLVAEKSHQVSASAEYNKGGFNASVSAYHNRFKDKIGMITRSDGNQEYQNTDKSKTTGVEAILRMKYDFGLSLTGSYAFVDDYAEYKGKNVSYVRPHSITFNASYMKKIRKVTGTLTLNGQWTSKLDTWSFNKDEKTQKETMTYVTYDPRTMCSLNLTLQMPRGITCGFMVDNLFNYKDKSADAGIQVPQKGISCVGSLSINLADLFKL